MRLLSLLIASAVLSVSAVAADAPTSLRRAPAPGDEIMNFAMLDTSGRFHELRRTDAKAVVLFFTSDGCPIARQSYSKLRALRKTFGEQGVAVWIVSTDSSESRSEIEREVRSHGGGSTTVLLDDVQGVTRMLGVKRTCEAIAIGTGDYKIFYRGAIDDQMVEGAKKPEPGARFLHAALEAFLAGEAITTPSSVARGCLIQFESAKANATEAVSYARDVAPLLAAKCAGCHSPGNIGQWSMSNHGKVKAKAAMMEEVILARRMPPWDADPEYGKFRNDRSLTPTEKRLLLSWIESGAPRGEGEDTLASLKVPNEPWPLGKPDQVVSLPKPQELPATGIVDYRYVDIPLELTNSVWLSAVAIKPDNLAATHHVIVRVKYPKEGRNTTDSADWLEGWSPGKTFERFPAGTGMRLKPGAVISFELHYTTTGKPEKDQTEIGLYFRKEKPALSYTMRMAVNQDLNIPPGQPDVRTFAMHHFKRDTLLYTLVPHMHTRGSWMRYEALYPDGKRQTLLHVPRYDFNWQIEYVLAEPKRLPAGTWILCSGGFDNSKQNPNNPDPTKRVSWGEQSFDEMFIGFMNVTDAPTNTLVRPTLSKK